MGACVVGWVDIWWVGCGDVRLFGLLFVCLHACLGACVVKRVLPKMIMTFRGPGNKMKGSALATLFTNCVRSRSGRRNNLSVTIISVSSVRGAVKGLHRSRTRSKVVGGRRRCRIVGVSSSRFVGRLSFLRSGCSVVLISFPNGLGRGNMIRALRFISIVVVPFRPGRASLEPALAFCCGVCRKVVRDHQGVNGGAAVHNIVGHILPGILRFGRVLGGGGALPFRLVRGCVGSSEISCRHGLDALDGTCRRPYSTFYRRMLRLVYGRVKRWDCNGRREGSVVDHRRGALTTGHRWRETKGPTSQGYYKGRRSPAYS